MKTHEDAAYEIGEAIHGLEDSIDLLLADTASLAAKMARYRVETDMDANMGQRALARISEMQKTLVDARMKTVGTHSDLKKIIETTADFPYKCPSTAEDETEAPVLKLAS